MFDIGFSELLVIGVVALVVIGPERLPKVARTLGHLFGRMQRYVAQVKADINREMEMSELSKVKTEFESAARDFQRDVETKAQAFDEEMRGVEADIDRQLRQDPGAAKPGAEALPAVPAEPACAAAEPASAQAQLELAIDEPGAKPAGPGPGAA
jgi:sec-independent protein translocase protein TatB